MQAPSGSQKRPPRPEAIGNPEPAVPRTSSPATTANMTGTRTSSGSTKSTGKRKDPATQLSQIEKSVTHLLVATKQLLETLTQWSRHQATEGEVSDVYVRLGYEFNIACRAFTSIGVPVDDLGPVPDLLRAILEETLSQEASPQSLDRFLPKIRDIIIGLLHGLKRKQSRLRAARAKDGSTSNQDSTTAQSERSQPGMDMQNENNASEAAMDSGPQYRSSTRTVEGQRNSERSQPEDRAVPQRAGTVPVPGPKAPAAAGEPRPASQDGSRSTTPQRKMVPSANSNAPLTSPNQPLSGSQSESQNGHPQRLSFHGETPAPPPPPKQDALAALQRGGELERRASRRYSAYQISKHLGASPGGVPMIPPPQHSPIPNRGKDVRESLNAVRTRSSLVPQRRSQSSKDLSSGRLTNTPTSAQESVNKGDTPTTASTAGGTPSKPSDSHLDASSETPTEEQIALSGTVSGPPPDAFSYNASTPQAQVRYEAPAQSPAQHQSPAQPQVQLQRNPSERTPVPISTPQVLTSQTTTDVPQTHFIPEVSPQPGRELTLFLQYKSRIKKIILPDGSNDLSMAKLQLAFIEKFAWNTHNNGVELPEIYIQDTVSGVRHELDDLADIKDRSVLVLNVEPLDEIKKHFDESIGNIRKLVEGVKTSVDGQHATISQVSDRQQDSAKEIARLVASPPSTRSNSTQINGSVRSPGPVVGDAAMREVHTLRRDLAIMRQTLTTFTRSVQTSMAGIRNKADAVKAKAVDVSIPTFEGETGRGYVNSGKKSLADDSDTLVNRVDDLQDVVEDLRKDVVNRGVRPLARQLEAANKDIKEGTKELKKMQEFVKREKPIWTKIWEKELELVCTDREFLTMQEELIADLEDDLEKANQTMTLVEQATRQQNNQASTTGLTTPLRATSRNIPNIDTADVDPLKAKDGVLGQVRALQPNHEDGLEAIERAEKARQRELKGRHRDAAFVKELGDFVQEGKLKKSGGVDEADRLRRQKDERAMKDEFEEQQNRKAERAKARAEERARLAAAAQSAATKPPAQDESDYEDEDEDEEKDGDEGQEESADEEMQDAQEENKDKESPDNRNSKDSEPVGVSSPARKSWLPAFMSPSS